MDIDEEVDSYESFMGWLVDAEGVYGVNITIQMIREGMLITVSRAGPKARTQRYIVPWIKWITSADQLQELKAPVMRMLQEFDEDT